MLVGSALRIAREEENRAGGAKPFLIGTGNLSSGIEKSRLDARIRKYRPQILAIALIMEIVSAVDVFNRLRAKKSPSDRNPLPWLL